MLQGFEIIEIKNIKPTMDEGDVFETTSRKKKRNNGTHPQLLMKIKEDFLSLVLDNMTTGQK